MMENEFNLLVDDLPTFVVVDDVQYPVNWNFRTFLLIEQLMEEDVLSDDVKLNIALTLFYDGDIPGDIREASNQLTNFYLGGSAPDIETEQGKKKKQRRIINYAYDQEYIFTAFLRSYNINLAKVEDLHWYEFKAMFQDFTEDCQLVKIIGYRTINLGDIKDKKQQKFYRDMKRKYELPVSKKAKDELKRIEAILLGDGDLTKR